MLLPSKIAEGCIRLDGDVSAPVEVGVGGAGVS